MNTTKIIKGVVGGGRYTVTAPIVKEDYGLYLKIEGVELPSTYKVDFSNSEHNGTSVTMIGNADGVLIPRQFITTGKDVFAFLYHVGADYGRTVYKFRIPNKLRPDRTEDAPTPEEQSVIDQAIGALNAAAAKTAQDVISADQSARSASDDADRAERARTGAETAQGKAEEAQESAERAKDDAETSERNASESERKAKGYAETASEKADAIIGLTAQATTLPDGSQASASYNAETGVMSFGIPKGKDGTDGDDGYSPTVTITPITGGHRITITDADGEHSADVMDGTGNVDDVQINGTSIVENGVANVPVATMPTSGTDAGNLGLTCFKRWRGISLNTTDNSIYIDYPSVAQVKAGNDTFKPVTTAHQHESTFYGLAKSAGDTTQSQSSNAVGVYTDTAKGKIQTMLGIADLIGNSEGATASKAYSVGDVFLYNGKLYEVTVSIASGSAIVPNTNCTQTTIIDLLRGV